MFPPHNLRLSVLLQPPPTLLVLYREHLSTRKSCRGSGFAGEEGTVCRRGYLGSWGCP